MDCQRSWQVLRRADTACAGIDGIGIRVTPDSLVVFYYIIFSQRFKTRLNRGIRGHSYIRSKRFRLLYNKRDIKYNEWTTNGQRVTVEDDLWLAGMTLQSPLKRRHIPRRHKSVLKAIGHNGKQHKHNESFHQTSRCFLTACNVGQSGIRSARDGFLELIGLGARNSSFGLVHWAVS